MGLGAIAAGKSSQSPSSKYHTADLSQILRSCDHPHALRATHRLGFLALSPQAPHLPEWWPVTCPIRFKQACPLKTNEKGRCLLPDPGDTWGHRTEGVDCTDRQDRAGSSVICHRGRKALKLEASQRQNCVCPKLSQSSKFL